MFKTIDSHRLNILHETPLNYANPAELRRKGRVFLIGGNLPVYSTLETMYESYCLEATELFHLTFGDADDFEHNIEMTRQIKRNFSIRLMGQIDYRLSAAQVEQVYLAGLDILDIPHQGYGGHPTVSTEKDSESRDETFRHATSAFTRWSVVSTISADRTTPEEIRSEIHNLLSHGVVPLLVLSGGVSLWNPEETRNIFLHLAAEWHRHRVPIKPIIPLLRLTTPFEFTASGVLREVIDKFQDRRIMATTDLLRHLRTSGAEASFESAGL